jgi:hypothetical protein
MNIYLDIQLNCILNPRTLSWFQILTFIIALISLIWNYIQQVKLENLKSENQKSIHVHKLQFEKEFKLYEDTWIKATFIMHELNKFELDHAKYDKAKNENDPAIKEFSRKVQERIEILIPLLTNMFDFIRENEPFYPKSVYVDVRQFINQSLMLSMTSQLTDYGFSWKQEYIKSQIKEGEQHLENICESIRNRIGILRSNN